MPRDDDTPQKEWHYRVLLSNDKQGFTRSFELIGNSAYQIIDNAFDMAEEKGYDSEDFAVSMLTRGREVGT